jgi:hypothetical protein
VTDAARLTRLYAFAIAILVFFVTWAAVAARPWVQHAARPDPRLAALAAREQRIHVQSVVLRKLAAARRQLAAAAPAPAPRIVTLPPLTITRTS